MASFVCNIVNVLEIFQVFRTFNKQVIVCCYLVLCSSGDFNIQLKEFR